MYAGKFLNVMPFIRQFRICGRSGPSNRRNRRVEKRSVFHQPRLARHRAPTDAPDWWNTLRFSTLRMHRHRRIREGRRFGWQLKSEQQRKTCEPIPPPVAVRCRSSARRRVDRWLGRGGLSPTIRRRASLPALSRPPASPKGRVRTGSSRIPGPVAGPDAGLFRPRALRPVAEGAVLDRDLLGGRIELGEGGVHRAVLLVAGIAFGLIRNKLGRRCPV
jgi:hypothetical protein